MNKLINKYKYKDDFLKSIFFIILIIYADSSMYYTN